VHLAAARERPLLAVERDPRARGRRVLERAPEEARRLDRHPVVREPGRARLGELDHLGQLLPGLGLRDRGEEADRHLGLGAGPLDERAEHGGRVDDGVGVRHREDGAEAARGGRARAGTDVFLVLAAGRAQVHVRVDERRREHEARRVDQAVAVRVEPDADLRHHAAVHADVDHRVDALAGIDHARAADDDVVLGAVRADEHHATSWISATLTPTGPCVSRS
jgi:hypothetical protein